MATQQSVKDKLAGKAGAVATTESRPRTLEDEVKGFLSKYGSLLPEMITPERMQGMILSVQKDLKHCTAASFYGSLIKAMQLGLEVGPLGHCYLLPFKNGRTGQHEVQFILGYKGQVELIYRSGKVLTLQARPVYEGDKVTISYGLEDTFNHIPYHQIEGAEKGKLKGVTLKVKFTNGGYLTDYMPICEIEEHRKRSLAKDSGPWKTDYEAMALKTIVRKNFRWMPVSTEVQKMIVGSDETVNRASADGTALDVEFTTVLTQETGELPMTSEEAADAAQGDDPFASSDTTK